eukprot:gene962-9869_t
MEHLQKTEIEQKNYIKEIGNQIDLILNQIEEGKKNISTNGTKQEILKIQKSFKSNFDNIKEEHKKFNSNLTKLGKSLESSFIDEKDNFSKLNSITDDKLLNELILEHFYREGYSSIGNIFEMESKIQINENYKKSFEEMYLVLDEMKKKNLKQGLEWCKKNGLKTLEFQFHKLIYIELIKNQEIKNAIIYSRNNFKEFKNENMNEIQHLMGSLTFSKNLKLSPYSDLLDESIYQNLIESFKKECCSFIGKSFENPFYILITAGSNSLPILLKLLSITKENVLFSNSNNQMSMELQLDDEFLFHSIFTCPISKELTTKNNPSILLPCCHVLSRKSVDKLLKGSKIKCPYCPMESTKSSLMEIYF